MPTSSCPTRAWSRRNGCTSASPKRACDPTHVYSSPLLRTADTARIAARSWDAPIVYHDDLKETDVGVFTGLTLDEAASALP